MANEGQAVIEDFTEKDTEAVGIGSSSESDSFELPVLTVLSNSETATGVSANEAIPEETPSGQNSQDTVGPIKEAIEDTTKPSNDHVAKSYMSEKRPITY